MARLVLLSIPDNREAEQFVHQIAEGQASGSHPVAYVPSDVSVEWMIGRPTRPCECAMKADPVARRKRRSVGRKSKDAFTKGRKLGWWLHAACGRPTRMVVDRFVTNLIGGNYDLLPQIAGYTDREPNDMRKYGGENWIENRETRRL